MGNKWTGEKKPPQEASPSPSEKKASPSPSKGGDVLLDEDLQYSPCLSSLERMGHPLPRRGLGRLSPLQRYTLHVTFLLMEFSEGRQGGYSLLLYIIYILYIIIILFIF